jgi:hypothetical protein
MENNTCETCRLCKAGEVQTDLKRQYFCHRYPPTTHAIPTQQGIVQMTSFPAVMPDMWCGEYLPIKPNS